MNGKSLVISGLVKHFKGVVALDRVDLEVRPGELLALVGPSGSGKTTALGVIAGLISPDKGKIFLGDKNITSFEPKDRDVAVVFQDGALYPHLTVENNLSFPLRARGQYDPDAVEKIADRLNISGLLARYPAQLSGGEKQRVALGRALIRKPKLFLLDEPLSELDLPLREQLRQLIRELVTETGVTTLYVTHDQGEAMSVADQVAVMKNGHIQQIAPPIEIYTRPENVFVAQFFGMPGMNLLKGIAENHTIKGTWGELAASGIPGSGPITVGFRPEQCRISTENSCISGRITNIEYFGHETVLTVSAENTRFKVRTKPNQTLPKIGQQTNFTIEKQAICYFDSNTGRRIS